MRSANSFLRAIVGVNRHHITTPLIAPLQIRRSHHEMSGIRPLGPKNNVPQFKVSVSYLFHLHLLIIQLLNLCVN
jgi:hypothetical protein